MHQPSEWMGIIRWGCGTGQGNLCCRRASAKVPKASTVGNAPGIRTPVEVLAPSWPGRLSGPGPTGCLGCVGGCGALSTPSLPTAAAAGGFAFLVISPGFFGGVMGRAGPLLSAPTRGGTLFRGVVRPCPSKHFTSICAAQARSAGSGLAISRIIETEFVLEATDKTAVRAL